MTHELTLKSGIRRKKGSLEETVSYALYKDDAYLFSVFYRDKNMIKKASLKDFIDTEEMSDIPLSRISSISRDGKTVWEKGQKEVRVKNQAEPENLN